MSENGQNQLNTAGAWLSRLRAALGRTTSSLSDGIGAIFTKRRLDEEMLEELEELLITSDMGVEAASRFAAELRRERFDKEVSAQDVKSFLAARIADALEPATKALDVETGHRPHVILVTGVNGSGKTTTIGKLAKQFRDAGKSVVLGAADTFRAAAIEQLQIWGERTGAPVVAGTVGADPAGIAFETMDRAISDQADIVLIDTAGRLQNRRELMDELAKIVRVIGRKIDGAPHDTVLVLDASTGQNAIQQVDVFQQVAHITGLIMTKLDGSARGGVLVACAERFALPIHAIGVGEAVEDLQPFNARDFAAALVGLDKETIE